MRFKIHGNSDTYNKLSDWFKRTDDACPLTPSLAEEFGATSFVTVNQNLAGFGFESRTPKEGWKYLDSKGDRTLHAPAKKNPQYAEIKERMNDVPFPKKNEINEIVGFKPQIRIGVWMANAGVEMHPNFALLILNENAEFKPNADMVELTTSQFNEFHKQVTDYRQDEKFQEWIAEMKRIAISEFEYEECATDFDVEAYRPYFAEGMTPKEALTQDAVNA